jgi:multidrug efflux pump subunit AcrB
MPPPVRGIGTSGGFRMMVEDRANAGPQALQGAVYAMMGRAAQTPGLSQVFSLFESSTPQLYLDIDRTKVQMLGVAMSDVFGALQTYLGSTYVNDFNLLGRVFRVTAQADAAYRLDPKDVLKIRVRNSSGDAVPLGSFTTSPPCAMSPAPTASHATTSTPPRSSTALPRPASRKGRRSASWRSSPPRRCRRA